MSGAFGTLERILNLESVQGFQNRSVIGGMKQFATVWSERARDEGTDDSDLSLIDQVELLLNEYDEISGREAREQAVRTIMLRLVARKARVDGLTDHSKVVVSPVAEKLVATRPIPTESAEKKEPDIELEPDPDGLKQSVNQLKGVGEKVAEDLGRLNAETIWDLLYLFPRRYDDYTQLKPISRLRPGDQVTLIATVWEAKSRRTRGTTLVRAVLSDGTGRIEATWFNQPWLVNQLKAGSQIAVRGTVEQFLGKPVFNNPDWEPVDLDSLKSGSIVPIYPLTKGLGSKRLRTLMRVALSEWAGRVPDPLPTPLRERHSFARLPQALRQVHFPESQQQLHAARRRIVFEELFVMQLGLLSFKQDWQGAPGMPIALANEHVDAVTSNLPFQLTEAQGRVLQEIGSDLAKDRPMNRLLQGDVGSGKTVVAAMALSAAVKGGFQAALMAPTEILAEQHHRSLSDLLGKVGISVRLLTGSTGQQERDALSIDLEAGTPLIVVGTHALIQESVNFGRLAMVVIDEQHRFGVDQRKALRDKGMPSNDGSGRSAPHLLVMTATPIPRSLALSIYGDLDLSIIDELPPGRQEIKTHWLKQPERERAYAFVRGQVEKGRQAFVICPLVEESENSESKAAVEEQQRLQEEIFPDLKLGLIHGRMKSAEKDAIMRLFHDGAIDILVATSVIEVGIDVPNASVMLVEGANRFGLAQLHQFRGRVGRGEHQSYCLLLADSSSRDAEQRLSALERTNDGFVLAEKDLEIRGPGEFIGRRQSGLPELKMASIMDMEMLALARREAEQMLEGDPGLAKEEHHWLREQVGRSWSKVGDIS